MLSVWLLKQNYLSTSLDVVHFQRTRRVAVGKSVQSNLDYPDLDYPDYSVIRTFCSGPNLFMNIN